MLRTSLWLLLTQGCVGPFPEARLSGTITSDTTLEAGRPWLIDGLVFVDGATLTIEPGTTLRGDASSALVIMRSGRIEARGTRDEPIVFTSNQPEGQRAAGDWGGLVMLGRAQVHEGTGAVEGIDENDPRGTYGGDDDEHSCGALQFVRIEFAGFFLDLDSDLNGLTLAGCGSGTIVDDVQTHLTLDDGIEIVGGTVNLRDIVITYPGGQALDWSEGWRGNLQYMIVQHNNLSGSAIEGENNDDELDETPLSAPTLFNTTLLGLNTPTSASRGLILRAGTGGVLRNSIVSGFGLDVVDLRDAETVANVTGGELQVSHLLASNVGVGGNTFFDPDDDVETDDGGFDESTWFLDEANANVTTAAAVLTDGTPTEDIAAADDLTPLPGAFTPPTQGLVVQAEAARPPEGSFWDQSATFIGAIRAGDSEEWWSGWTRFPAN